MQKEWTSEFSSQPPTRLTISRIRDKFEEEGTVRDMMEYTGRPQTFADSKNSHVLQGNQLDSVLVRLESANQVFIGY